MAAGLLNFDDIQCAACEQGATFERSFFWEDGAGNRVILTNYVGKMQVRKNFKDDLIIELSTENGRIEFDSNSNIVLLIDAEVTAEIPAGNYIYDLEVYHPGDMKVRRLFKGRFVVTPEVTL